MTHRITFLAVTLAASLAASSASAACMAEYKAKQDNPLRLEHGTVQISGPCTTEAAEAVLTQQLAEKGWTLLKVLSVSDQ